MKTIGDQYDVSIVVPTYNRAKYLCECLESLLNQSVPATEIIVVDDGSEDNTSDVVRTFGEKITYVKKKNEGKPTAVNVALSMVKGNLVWVFDDDDYALPHAIESRVTTLKANPAAGLVYSPHYLGSDGPNGAIVKGPLYQPPLHDDSDFFFELLKGCFFHLASALVRIEAYRAIGGFDTGLVRSQDYDAQIRLARKFRCVYSPVPSFIFRQHAGPRGTRETRHEGSKRGHVFQIYDQRIGRKIRSTVALNDYLTPRQETKELSQTERRDALLSRMIVMGSKGCIDEMFEDLEEALELSSNTEFDRLISERVLEATTSGYAFSSIYADWTKFKNHLQKIRRYANGKYAINAFAKGFFLLAKSYPGSLGEKLTKLKFCAITLSRRFKN